jgi:hypothetical protein
LPWHINRSFLKSCSKITKRVRTETSDASRFYWNSHVVLLIWFTVSILVCCYFSGFIVAMINLFFTHYDGVLTYFNKNIYVAATKSINMLTHDLNHY